MCFFLCCEFYFDGCLFSHKAPTHEQGPINFLNFKLQFQKKSRAEMKWRQRWKWSRRQGEQQQPQQAVSPDSLLWDSDRKGVWSSCSVAVVVAAEVTSGEEAAPPSFVRRPSAQRLVEGGSVVFQCQVSGNPRPHVIWKKSGVPLTTGYRCETDDAATGGSSGARRRTCSQFNCRSLCHRTLLVDAVVAFYWWPSVLQDMDSGAVQHWLLGVLQLGTWSLLDFCSDDVLHNGVSVSEDSFINIRNSIETRACLFPILPPTVSLDTLHDAIL